VYHPRLEYIIFHIIKKSEAPYLSYVIIFIPQNCAQTLKQLVSIQIHELCHNFKIFKSGSHIFISSPILCGKDMKILSLISWYTILLHEFTIIQMVKKLCDFTKFRTTVSDVHKISPFYSNPSQMNQIHTHTRTHTHARTHTHTYF
jgi:hypothetical protein